MTEGVRTGTVNTGPLPTPGPWFLAATTLNGVETIIACAPDHPPIFFRDGERFDIFAGWTK